MSRIKFYVPLLILLLSISMHAQISKLNFSINNFIHQKSDFTFLNDMDTKGAFLEATATFGQHYFLTKEAILSDNFTLSYGLGIGYTGIKYRYKLSEDFLSIGRVNRFTETSNGLNNTMFISPIGILYEIFSNDKFAFYLNMSPLRKLTKPKMFLLAIFFIFSIH